MTTVEMIRSVYLDPEVEGMDRLYAAIRKQLSTGMTFEKAYNHCMEAQGEAARIWITFCVQCAGRFKDPPEESMFLSVLEEFCRMPPGTAV